MQNDTLTTTNTINADLAVAPAVATAPVLSPEQRIAQDDAVLAQYGVATTAQIREAYLNGRNARGTNDGMLYAPGTLLMQSGHDTVKAGRAKHDALPAAPEAARRLAARLAAENRNNEIVPLFSIRSSLDGENVGVISENGIATRIAAPSERGWALVGGRISEGLASYLPVALPDVRRFALERHVAKLVEQHQEATRQAIAAGEKPPKAPMVSYATRDRKPDTRSKASRELYRMAGPRYSTALEAQHLLPELANALPEDWKAETRYERNKSKWQVEATMHAKDIDVVGEVFKAGIRISGDDTLGEAVSMRIIVVRARCINATPVRSLGKKLRFRHTANNANDAIAAIAEEMASMQEALAGFGERWGYAKHMSIEKLAENPGDTIADLCRRAGMRLPGGDEGKAAVARAFAVEPGNTLDAAVNAITRAAHEHGAWWNDLALSEHVEEVASNLLYARIA